jgi:hypothetical protein
MTNEEIFRGIVRHAVEDGTLIVEFGPTYNPKYIPAEQLGHGGVVSRINFPCTEYGYVDASVKTDQICLLLQKVSIERSMVIFSHEYGHHLTDNPTYDSALKNCLNLPVSKRSEDDMNTVVKEEREAWDHGFRELRALGYEPSPEDLAFADDQVEEYRIGVTSIEPAK